MMIQLIHTNNNMPFVLLVKKFGYLLIACSLLYLKVNAQNEFAQKLNEGLKSFLSTTSAMSDVSRSILAMNDLQVLVPKTATDASLSSDDLIKQGIDALKNAANPATMNEEIAFQLFKQAADQGSSPALLYVGMMLKAGTGVQKNEEEGQVYLTEAAKKSKEKLEQITQQFKDTNNKSLPPQHSKNLNIMLDKFKSLQTDYFSRVAEQNQKMNNPIPCAHEESKEGFVNESLESLINSLGNQADHISSIDSGVSLETSRQESASTVSSDLLEDFLSQDTSKDAA